VLYFSDQNTVASNIFARNTMGVCCVAQIEDGVHVSDVGSTNGTRINGRSVRSGRLRPGDDLTITHLRYGVKGERPGLDG